jgi:hypothetical protein
MVDEPTAAPFMNAVTFSVDEQSQSSSCAA